MLVRDYLPALRYGAKILSSEVIGGLEVFSKAWYVDGDNGSDSDTGETPDRAFKTIQAAVTASSADDVIYVRALDMATTATDPSSYTENIVITGKDRLKIIGVSNNRTQGGLPQVKVGSTTTSPIIDIRSQGVTIANLGINGAGATGGGILLNSDSSTYDAFGASIIGCHFKNCVGTTATDCRTGGAIMWPAVGNSWQVRISGNVFYKNVGGVVLKGTSNSVPQDVVIENNTFQGTAATVDCYLYLAGGSGMSGVTVNNNTFASVLPALSSGSIVRYADMTGCTGIFSNNFFASTDTTTGFGAAKASAKIPTTVGIAHNYSDGGLIVREA